MAIGIIGLILIIYGLYIPVNAITNADLSTLSGWFGACLSIALSLFLMVICVKTGKEILGLASDDDRSDQEIKNLGR